MIVSKMDDTKEKKLAAARKKLKKFQKKKDEESGKNSNSHENSLVNSGISESSSRSSSISDINSISDNLKSNNSNSSSQNDLVRIDNQLEIPLNVQPAQFTDNYILENDCVVDSDTMENDKDCSVYSGTNASMATVIQGPSNNALNKSTSENLRQLSLQMSGLVSDVEKTDPGGLEMNILELEKRNTELASLLSNEKQMSLQQNQIIEELRTRLSMQDSQIQTLQNMALAGNSNTEITGLREQLQVHIQTIGILVAEKSDLQSSLANVKHNYEQKSCEVTDLQGRLDASRQRIRDLENTAQKLELKLSTINDSEESKTQQILNLQSEHSKMSKLCDELRSSLAEVTERLAMKTEDNKKMCNEVSELRRQLDMANIHIEQLKDSTHEDIQVQFDQLQMSLKESQREIAVLRTTANTVQLEKTKLEEEYKSYASQLAADTEKFKNNLSIEEEKRVRLEQFIEELKKKLEDETKSRNDLKSIEVLEEEKSQLLNTIKKLENDNTSLSNKCDSLEKDNGQLSQMLAEQNTRLDTLEADADRNSTNKVDTTQLLQSMQSSKIAAARALTQNKQLKEQLEELQNGFIMMSNKKLELTEKLERELHIKKSLHQQITKLEEEITSYKEELIKLRRGNYYHKDEKSDDEPEVESSTNTANDQSQETPIDRNQSQTTSISRDQSETTSISRDLSQMHTISQVEETKHNVKIEEQSCTESDPETKEVAEQVNYSDNKINGDSNLNTGQLETVSLKTAHECLQNKFMKCMRELATLSDEKQNLEYLVQKLQLETDTVGDYITIYQFQRGVMKRQMQEITSEVEILRVEKEDMTSKLSKLQKLFTALINNETPQQGVLNGINSILELPSKADNKQSAESNSLTSDKEEDSEVVSINSPENGPKISNDSNQRMSDDKKGTVKQIMDLLNEMESNSQLDIAALYKLSPCSHCSGKLQTI